MKEADIKTRIEQLYEQSREQTRRSGAYELYQGALSVMIALHGESSSQVTSFRREREQISEKATANTADIGVYELARGAINNLKAEVDAGFAGSLQQTITGEVITDFVKLAHYALDQDKSDESKNVAAVLAAASFEDTLRRLTENHNIPHIEKLAELLNELKKQNILKGTQVSIANGYLSFRNNALHAQFDKVDRASVSAVLAFVESLLLTEF
jgi:hypothetical protein